MKKIYFLLITIGFTIQLHAALNFKTDLTEEEVNAITQEESNDIQQILCFNGFCSGPKIDAILNKIGYEGKDWKVKATKQEANTAIEVYGRDSDASYCKYIRICKQGEVKFLGRFLVRNEIAQTSRSYEQLNQQMQQQLASNTILDHKNKLYERVAINNSYENAGFYSTTFNVFDQQSGEFAGVVKFTSSPIISKQHIKDEYVNPGKLESVDKNLIHENQGKQQVTPVMVKIHGDLYEESQSKHLSFENLPHALQKELIANSIIENPGNKSYRIGHEQKDFIQVYDDKTHIGVINTKGGGSFADHANHQVQTQHIVTKYIDNRKLDSVDKNLIHKNQGEKTPTPFIVEEPKRMVFTPGGRGVRDERGNVQKNSDKIYSRPIKTETVKKPEKKRGLGFWGW